MFVAEGVGDKERTVDGSLGSSAARRLRLWLGLLASTRLLLLLRRALRLLLVLTSTKRFWSSADAASSIHVKEKSHY